MAAFVSFTTGAASRSVTVPAGTDRLLVAIAHSNASTAARTATYNGVSMSVASTANGWTQIFYMLNPAAGAATLAVSGANISSVVAAHYTGIGSFQSGQEGSVASASFVPNMGGAIVFGMVAGSVTHTPLSNTNERQEGGDYYADRLVTTSGSVTVGVSSATDPDYAGAIFGDSVNASGTLNAPKATSTGTATPVSDVTVTGSITAPVATASGTAVPVVGVPVDVTGSLTAPSPSVSGSAGVVVSVSGSITAPVASVSAFAEPVGVDSPHADVARSNARGSAAFSLPTATFSTSRARGSAASSQPTVALISSRPSGAVTEN